MGFFRDFIPPEDPDTDKGGFQVKGQQSFDGQRGAKNVAHKAGIF